MTYTYIGNRKFEYSGEFKGNHRWEYRTLSNRFTMLYREGFGLVLKDLKGNIGEVPDDFEGDVARYFDNAIAEWRPHA